MGLRATLQSLPVRLVLLLAIALLPLGAISVFQTNAIMEESQALSRAALLDRTKGAASAEREVIREAIGAADSLSAVINTLDQAACTEVLEAFARARPEVAFAGSVGLDGIVGCATAGRGTDFSQDAAFQSLLANPQTTVTTNLRGGVSGQAVVIVSVPRLRNGVLEGFVSVSLPLEYAQAQLPEADRLSGLKMALVNTDGSIISATQGVESAPRYLPAGADLATLAASPEMTFNAQAADGSRRFFAVAPIVPGAVAAVGSWPAEIVVLQRPLWRVVSLSFPIVMGLVGLVVAYLGIMRLVIRHVDRLKSAMRQFALGRIDEGGLNLGPAPTELKEAERAFNRMASLVLQAEAQVANELEEKKILLHEVHHRVKNNLQLIASIMNMQMRQANTQEAVLLLESLQSRVRGLSLLHKTLYGHENMATVDTAEVIAAIMSEIEELARAQQAGAEVETHAVSVQLVPDQAVPLSMLVSEALTNSVKYLGAPEGQLPRVSLQLKHGETPEALVLEIVNTVSIDEETGTWAEGTSLGTRLISAFASQLGGTVTQERADGIYLLRLEFTRDMNVPDI